VARIIFKEAPLALLLVVRRTSKIRGQINTNFSVINLGPVDVAMDGADRSYARHDARAY
jgi:hypothetical protein